MDFVNLGHYPLQLPRVPILQRILMSLSTPLYPHFGMLCLVDIPSSFGNTRRAPSETSSNERLDRERSPLSNIELSSSLLYSNNCYG